MLKISSMVSNHVRFLLQMLTDADADSIAEELHQFVGYGVETSILVLLVCLEYVTIQSTGANKSRLEKVMSSIFKYVMDKPNFRTAFCQSIRNAEVSEEFLDNLSNALSLSVSKQIGVGVVLSDLERRETRTSGSNFCMALMEKLCAKHVDSFMQHLSLLLSRDEFDFVSTPILSVKLHEAKFFRGMSLQDDSGGDDFDSMLVEMEKEISVGDLVEALRYGCTADSIQCKEILSCFISLTVANIPRIMCTIVQTHVGLEDIQNPLSNFSLALGCRTSSELPALRSWSLDTLVETVKQLAFVDSVHSHEHHLGLANHALLSLLLFGMAHIKTAYNLIQHEVASAVFPNVEPHIVVRIVEICRDLMVNTSEFASCCLRNANLLEECRFFPEYPERQLKIVPLLFVIEHQLVTHPTLGIALRRVLDALHKPADSKMFVFGTKALEQFVNRLIEWPQYCNHILQIPHLRTTHPELVAVIEQALAKISSGHLESDGSSNTFFHQYGPSRTSSENVESSVNRSATSSISAGFVRTSSGATSTSNHFLHRRFRSTLNIETLVAAAERREKRMEAPASEVQDKISFMVNNISVANIKAKAKAITRILSEHYYPWFAQYMVVKRASIFPDFHDLYLKFLDKVNSKALYKEIVQATYENCKVLLGSELIKSSSEERCLLKNLGCWLGKVTIGRNKALMDREINPKSLIVEAYEKGLMIAVIPFTSKILEPCQNSIVYQPPNPWTMGILGLLAEIYAMPNLKMNLKFDIEALYDKLGVDMKDVTPTSLLKERKREIEGNPDFMDEDIGVSQISQPSDTAAEATESDSASLLRILDIASGNEVV